MLCLLLQGGEVVEEGLVVDALGLAGVDEIQGYDANVPLHGFPYALRPLRDGRLRRENILDSLVDEGRVLRAEGLEAIDGLAEPRALVSFR